MMILCRKKASLLVALGLLFASGTVVGVNTTEANTTEANTTETNTSEANTTEEADTTGGGGGRLIGSDNSILRDFSNWTRNVSKLQRRVVAWLELPLC